MRALGVERAACYRHSLLAEAVRLLLEAWGTKEVRGRMGLAQGLGEGRQGFLGRREAFCTSSCTSPAALCGSVLCKEPCGEM
jgi:hypothetical protein